MNERYKQLFYSSIILFSSYFSYDIPAALNKNIHLGDSKFTSYEITVLYSVYAFPNIFVPLIFTFVTEYSESSLNIFLSFLVLVGQCVFTLGIFKGLFYVAVLGRLLFGIGNETLFVIQSKLITTSFKGRELAFALALFTSLGRLGIVFNFLITPYLAKRYNATVPSVIGLFLILVGLVLNLMAKRRPLQIYHADLNIGEPVRVHNTDKTVVVVPDVEHAPAVHLPEFVASGCFFGDEANVWNEECLMDSKPMKLPCRTEPSTFFKNSGSRNAAYRKIKDGSKERSCFVSDENYENLWSGGDDLLNENEGMVSAGASSVMTENDHKDDRTMNASHNGSVINQPIHGTIIDEHLERSNIGHNHTTYSNNDALVINQTVENRTCDITGMTVSEKGKRTVFTSQNALKKHRISFDDITDLDHSPVISTPPGKTADKQSINPYFSMLVLIAFLSASVWAPFYNLGPLLFQKRYGYTREVSASMMGLLEIIQMFTIVVIGLLSDLTGIKLLFVAFGALLLMFSHVCIYLNYNIIAIICTLGIAGPLHSCYWPCVINLASQEQLSLAFAIISSFLNLSFTVSPLLASYLLQIDNTFRLIEGVSIIFAILTFIMVVMLNFIDFKKKLGMNRKVKC
ncbi:hypothetical protein VCUG_01848 [Vavraia culicis subsp. floridensis]|uniref:Lysosomal dipeptide transporter MFSD1 n=1 Tax=Vavraia culicis (isolate floridensis) TaxID=948595 RepID=L2GTR8_VAVCU|nr:uncharacterized protein VCUG_01848 [Vavraia culicis subsp. floridensis]ELA46698.1 hypothetical protein VCUG_01848 [Vavraia culicis subsp. floridensis]